MSKEQNSDTNYTDITIQHLESFATEGLRTLVIASREISEEEYSVCFDFFIFNLLIFLDPQLRL